MSEQRIGLVVSDVDGTLVDQGILSPVVAAAAQALRQQGTKLVTSTARSHALLSKLVEPLNLGNNLCVLDGGATIARATSGEALWSRWLGTKTLPTVVQSIAQQCVKVYFDMETRSQEPAQVLAALKQDAAQSIDAPSVFAVFEAGRSAAIVEALGVISGIQSTNVMAYDKNPDWRCIQVLSEGIDKQSGTERVRRYDELSIQTALITGDGVNDIPLFHAAREGDVTAAIRNRDTPQELLDMADLVVPSVQEDGFVRALQHYKIL